MSTDPDKAAQKPLLSSEELTEIKNRCEQATQGPWKSHIEGRDCESGSSFIMTGGEDIYLTGASSADQDFIANAREDVPRLIAEIERLRKI